ncbi:MAG TPA: hypothetical protein PL110_11825 [Candidatus Eremiobacteraeota bacterium]|nr:MAG: hypothetical protein BWY64_01791 [bacterium ADurb.Bin363]HPZ08797.1 hypothetical protein [Candidatus Eremiobacteraeota bacterium]
MKDYFEHSKTNRIENCPGSHGYPSFATKEKGKRIIERMKEKALRWILKEERAL